MGSGTSETRLGSPASYPAPAVGFAPGTVLADRYRVVAMAGRGGMGEVYRADDLRLGQTVALKFLPASLERDPAARERLLAEVRNARLVSHPNVCRVFDVGEVEGRCFLTMEYIDGEDLASLLRRIGRLPAAKALEVARQLCAGLAAAHDRGVLHRDLKPANVMIDGRGQARITDFGLAVAAETAVVASKPRTSYGADEVAGTVAYLAPERFEGRPATVQSDLYALGLVLYETCTGKPAVSATTLDGWRRAHRDSTPSQPSAIVSDIEPAVERAIVRCLEKDPAKRPASVAQLAASLPGGDPLAAAIAAGETPSPELVAASGEEGTLPRVQAWLWFGACLIALSLALPLGSGWQLPNRIDLHEPAALKQTARALLGSLGYQDPREDGRGDRTWSIGVRSDRLRDATSAADASRERWADTIFFAYRESPTRLFTWNPFGVVTRLNPPVTDPRDAYVALDGRGRLLAFRAGTAAARGVNPNTHPAPYDWKTLFNAAELDFGGFTEVAGEGSPDVTADEHHVWEGRVRGEAGRVWAAAYRGRPVEFFLERVASRSTGRSTVRSAGYGPALDLIVMLGFFGLFGVLAALARRNWSLGRGDRKGAARLAAVVFAANAAYLVFGRHWTFSALDMLRVLGELLGLAFVGATEAWVYYMALEPYVRRRWPRLLIEWTRLLDGRWRDPLVGRSIMVGCSVGLVVEVVQGALATIVAPMLGHAVPPAYPPQSLDGGLAWFVRSTAIDPGVLSAVAAVGVLVIARFIVRSHAVAWVCLFVAATFALTWAFSLDQPWFEALDVFVGAAVAALMLVVLLARRGLLALAAALIVCNAMVLTPLTCRVTDWYFWRTGVVVVLIVGLAHWGFRNALGGQSAFAAAEEGATASR